MIRFLILFLVSVLSFSSDGFASSSLFSSDIKATFEHAKQTKKSVIIDFYGIWCPPCNQMDETVFDTPSFIQKAAGFELLKVDADAESSWQLKNKYKVGGYPTILFADPDGNEIYRVVGSRSPSEFFRVMTMVQGSKAKSYQQACKSNNTDDLWRCALTCGERKDKVCAEKAYAKLEKKLKKGTARYELARTYFVENAENEDLKRDGYERLLTEFPDSPLALVWSMDYLNGYKTGQPTDAKKKLVEKVVARSQAMLTDERREEIGMAPTDVLEARAELLSKLGRVEESKQAWKEAADKLEALSSKLPADVSPRGFAMERIECLESAGDIDGALKLTAQFRALYPKEFTFHFLGARVLQDGKRYPEALPVAQQAYDVSYGDNKIRAAILLLQLYATVPNKEAGKKIYEEVSKEKHPEASLEVRTHRYLKQLDAVWKKLNS